MEANIPKLILASASPRRKALLEGLGVPFTVRVAGVEESHGALEPEALVLELAARKAAAVVDTLSQEELDAFLVIACDTVVALDGSILEKPRDAADATRMLHALSGRRHQVLSGLCLRRGSKEVREAVCTEVVFRSLTVEEIDRYVATGEPLDKAGAYGIQGKAAPFVQEIHGDYYTVMGLPLCRLTQLLRSEFSLDILKDLR